MSTLFKPLSFPESFIYSDVWPCQPNAHLVDYLASSLFLQMSWKCVAKKARINPELITLPLLNHLQGRKVHLTPLSSNSNLRNYYFNTDMKSFLCWGWGFLLRSILYQAAIDFSTMSKTFLASRLCLILILSSGHFQCVGPICESGASATCHSHQDGAHLTVNTSFCLGSWRWVSFTGTLLMTSRDNPVY